ncbi:MULTISPECIES: DUF6507 family protein [Microbacterium]|jgi:hypothetical protein|uniref:Uncharacterized protein n=1 Tax=Microbacterium mcarthurae TaxID=3035918 RepID=A0ABW9GF24_9MICO|nr:DUF6507 family protein [Microbacterium sp. ACRRU]MCG7416038.1 hypothetical protein [Microbacterium sp. ACRRU]
MSYSIDPPQVLLVAERMTRSLDDLHEVATALRRAADSVAHALARAVPAHPAFLEVAETRIDLAHRIVGRGRAAVAALQSAVLAYLDADDEMAATTDARSSATGAPSGNPFDPIVFGKRRV